MSDDEKTAEMTLIVTYSPSASRDVEQMFSRVGEYVFTRERGFDFAGFSTMDAEADAARIAARGIVQVDTRSDETVERVARALHAAEHCGHPDEFTEVDPRCYADARAVLAALASPAPTKESQ